MAEKKSWERLLSSLTRKPTNIYRNVIFALTDKDKTVMQDILQNLNVTIPNMARILFPGEREVHKRFVLELDGKGKFAVLESLEDYGKLDVYFAHYVNILPDELVPPFRLRPFMPSSFDSIDSLKIFQLRQASDIPVGSAMAQFNYKEPGALIGVIFLVNGDGDVNVVHGPGNLLKISETISMLYGRVVTVMGTKEEKHIKALYKAYGVA